MLANPAQANGDPPDPEVAVASAVVSVPSPQFAALACQLDPPDGLLLGRCSQESLVERTDATEAATSARRCYHVVSLAALPAKLTVAGAAQVARARAAENPGAVIGWYRRRIGGQLRPDQQPQQVQLSAKEAHIHGRLCAEFNSPDLLLLLVRHVTDQTTRALVTDTTAVRVRWRAGGFGGRRLVAMECLPLVVQPLVRTPLPRGGGGAVDGASGECDQARSLRDSDRKRSAPLARKLVKTADTGFAESQLTLESLTESLLLRMSQEPPRQTAAAEATGTAPVGDTFEEEELRASQEEDGPPDSPVF